MIDIQKERLTNNDNRNMTPEEKSPEKMIGNGFEKTQLQVEENAKVGNFRNMKMQDRSLV